MSRRGAHSPVRKACRAQHRATRSGRRTAAGQTELRLAVTRVCWPARTRGRTCRVRRSSITSSWRSVTRILAIPTVFADCDDPSRIGGAGARECDISLIRPLFEFCCLTICLRIDAAYPTRSTQSLPTILLPPPLTLTRYCVAHNPSASEQFGRLPHHGAVHVRSRDRRTPQGTAGAPAAETTVRLLDSIRRNRPSALAG